MVIVDKRWLHICRNAAFITDHGFFKKVLLLLLLFQAVLVPAGQRAELLSNKADVVLHENLVCRLSKLAAIAEIGTLSGGLDP